MGIFDLFTSREPTRSRAEPTINVPAIRASTLENPSVALSQALSGMSEDFFTGQDRFGPSVNERSAMAVSAVYRCVTLISGMIANLPLKVFERTADGRREASGHRLSRLLKMEPMPGQPMTAHAFKEALVQSVLLHGNGYAVIRMDMAARVTGLEFALPQNVQPVWTQAGDLVYRVEWPRTKLVEYVDYDSMIHIAGPGFDGVCGVSRIAFNARDAVSLSKLLEEQTGYAHANASRPSLFVEAGKLQDKDAAMRFKAQFDDRYGGWKNSGKAYIGGEGSKVTVLQMSPTDLATIESRQFQVADISRYFGVPLALLNEVSGSTSWGSGLAEQNLAFLAYTLDADLSRIENVLNARLLGDGRFYVEFERGALLAMNPVSAAQIAQTEVSFGGLTPNEYRRRMNREPVEGGDKPFMNSTNQPLDAILNPPAPAAPAPGGNDNAQN